MKYLNVGDKVMVKMTDDGCDANRMLMKYDGMTMIVTRRQAANSCGSAYYELAGAKSDKGTPYGFLKEWLITL